MITPKDKAIIIYLWGTLDFKVSPLINSSEVMVVGSRLLSIYIMLVSPSLNLKVSLSPSRVSHMLGRIQQVKFTIIYMVLFSSTPLKVIRFIASEGTGSKNPIKPYESRLMGLHANVLSCFISTPYIISTYFLSCVVIIIHNQQ